MIIGKRFKSLFMFIFVLLCLSMCLMSCGADDTDEPDVSDDALSVLLEITEEYESSAEAECYVIVIPATSSGSLVSKANELALGIEEKTGSKCIVQYDNEEDLKLKKSVEIILGDSDRTESKVALSGLRAKDYICKKVDGTIVIGGVSDSKTVEAVDRFIKDVLPYSDSEQLMSSGAEFSSYGTYSLNGVKLLGFPINDFRIICNFDNDDIKKLADSLSSDILDKSGYALEVVDAEKGKVGVKEIVFEIDESCRSDEAYIVNGSEDVIFRAYDTYGLSLALECFRAAMIENYQTDEIFVGDKWTSRTVKYSNPKFPVKYIYFYNDGMCETPLDKISLIYEEFIRDEIQVLFVGALNSAEVDLINKRFVQKSKCLIVERGEDDFSAVIYNEDLFSVELSFNDSNSERFEVFMTVTESEQKYSVTYFCPYGEQKAADINGMLNLGTSSDMVIIEAEMSEAEIADCESYTKAVGEIISDGKKSVFCAVLCDKNEITFSDEKTYSYDELTSKVGLSAKVYGVSVKKTKPVRYINN